MRSPHNGDKIYNVGQMWKQKSEWAFWLRCIFGESGAFPCVHRGNSLEG